MESTLVESNIQPIYLLGRLFDNLLIFLGFHFISFWGFCPSGGGKRKSSDDLLYD